MENKFIEKATATMKLAVEYDIKAEDDKANRVQHLTKALSHYKLGIEYFLLGVKYSKLEKQKIAIKHKVVEYMQRAEEIKEVLSNKDLANTPKVVTADGKTKKNEDDDPETAKLISALESAIVTETPNVSWDDVAGLEGAKDLLKEAVILPVKFPQLFHGKLKPWKGILLYGPPGTGKSYIAKAVATEFGNLSKGEGLEGKDGVKRVPTFLSVSSSDLVSKFQGESERLVRSLFDLARAKAPAIIFIDEVDSLCGARGDGENESSRRIKTEFLVQMQGVGKGTEGILVLGATNTPWDLDPAIRRRFEKRVYISLPELAARTHMFKVHIGSENHTLTESDFSILGSRTEGFSGSDISVVVRDAMFEPLRTCQAATHFRKVTDESGQQPFLWEPCSPAMEKQPDVKEMGLMEVPNKLLKPLKLSMQNFLNVLDSVKPTVAKGDLTRQEEWTREFGQEG